MDSFLKFDMLKMIRRMKGKNPRIGNNQAIPHSGCRLYYSAADAHIPHNSFGDFMSLNRPQNTENGNTSLAEHLNTIADKLFIVSEKEKDPERKAEIFNRVFDLLENDALTIQEMVESLNDEAPEKVLELCRDLDENFAKSANFFLSAIDLLIEFLNTEETDFIKQAKEEIGKGSELLKTAGEMMEGLKNIPLEDNGEE